MLEVCMQCMQTLQRQKHFDRGVLQNATSVATPGRNRLAELVAKGSSWPSFFGGLGHVV
jgi:hypothetical protein